MVVNEGLLSLFSHVYLPFLGYPFQVFCQLKNELSIVFSGTVSFFLKYSFIN
jgi:hypothetical protein